MTPERWETDERDLYCATFDEDADAYDRTRPVAPDVVVDDAVRLARLHPGSSVVEIGPGTGQATGPLAASRPEDPGPRARSAPGRTGPPEPRGGATRLCAHDVVRGLGAGRRPVRRGVRLHSFHWVDPDVRFAKAAAVLGPTGHLIVLSTPWVVPDDADRFWLDIQDDWAAVCAERVDPAKKHPDRVADLGSAVRASGWFEEPSIVRHRFDVTFTADDYATNLSTQSGTKELAPEAQAELVARVRHRVEAQGGTVKAHLLAVLTVAKRAGASPEAHRLNPSGDLPL